MKSPPEANFRFQIFQFAIYNLQFAIKKIPYLWEKDKKDDTNTS